MHAVITVYCMCSHENALGAREGQGDSMLLADIVAGCPCVPGGQCPVGSLVYTFIIAYFTIAQAVNDT